LFFLLRQQRTTPTTPTTSTTSIATIAAIAAIATVAAHAVLAPQRGMHERVQQDVVVAHWFGGGGNVMVVLGTGVHWGALV